MALAPLTMALAFNGGTGLLLLERAVLFAHLVIRHFLRRSRHHAGYPIVFIKLAEVS
jgi:hypothetical protein